MILAFWQARRRAAASVCSASSQVRRSRLSLSHSARNSLVSVSSKYRRPVVSDAGPVRAILISSRTSPVAVRSRPGICSDYPLRRVVVVSRASKESNSVRVPLPELRYRKERKVRGGSDGSIAALRSAYIPRRRINKSRCYKRRVPGSIRSRHETDYEGITRGRHGNTILRRPSRRQKGKASVERT